MNRDLTVGTPSTVLRRFCIPLLGSVLFQQFYNLADSFVAGRFIGEKALAAVGNGYEITLIFLAFAFGCNIGCSVVVSRLFGGKKYGELKTAVSTTMIATGILCAILMSIGLLTCRHLLIAIQTPDEVLPDSVRYLRIYIWGLPFVFFYNVSNGIFSALGDSRTPFLFLVVSSLSNIGVDILFVVGCSMGVPGVAWATFLCQGISCAFALFFVFRRIRGIPSDGRIRLFSWTLFQRIAKIAVPSILQQSFVSVGNILIQGVVNSFGVAAMAGYSAAIKLNNLVITSIGAFGNGVSNFTAQNLGAGKKERIVKGYRSGLGMVVAFCCPIIVLYLVFGKYLLLAFMNDSGREALAIGIRFLVIVAPFYLVIAVKIISDSVLRGTGKMVYFMLATFTDLFLRVLLAYILSGTWETTGIWMSWPIGWVISAIMSFVFCMRVVVRKGSLERLSPTR